MPWKGQHFQSVHFVRSLLDKFTEHEGSYSLRSRPTERLANDKSASERSHLVKFVFINFELRSFALANLPPERLA